MSRFQPDGTHMFLTTCGYGVSDESRKEENEHYWLMIQFLLLERKSRNYLKARSDALNGESFSVDVNTQKLIRLD